MPENNKEKGHDKKLLSIDEICSTTWEPLYRYIYYKVQNREQAEDITQETYVKAISYLQKGKTIQPEKYIGFLKAVALNVLRDLWRKDKRRGKKVNMESINPMESAIEDPAENHTHRILIENALKELNNEQRTVIELRILKGYSVAETAKIMEKKEGTVRVMQHRALQNLSTLLNFVKEDQNHGF